MDDSCRRPWYSFRWKILLWIFVPLAVIALSDIVAVLLLAIQDKGGP